MMNTLPKIQKAFQIIGIFTKIALVFSIIGAVCCAIGALCTLAWYTGGQALSLFGQPIIFFEAGTEANEAMAILLSELVPLVMESVLLFFACQYIKLEQAEGTPFTEKGADALKKLGIRCIWMPIVVMVIVPIILLSLNADKGCDFSNLPGLATGLVLILASVIFRYGAELEAGCQARTMEKYE